MFILLNRNVILPKNSLISGSCDGLQRLFDGVNAPIEAMSALVDAAELSAPDQRQL